MNTQQLANCFRFVLCNSDSAGQLSEYSSSCSYSSYCIDIAEIKLSFVSFKTNVTKRHKSTLLYISCFYW